MASLDTIFDVLSEERRRYALYYLEERNEPVPVDELAERIADWESDASEEVPDRRFADVDLSLRHVHLPKTAEIDFVEYDRETGIVKVHGTPPEFDAVLSIAEIIENPKADD